MNQKQSCMLSIVPSRLYSYLIFGRNCQLNKVVSRNLNCWKLSGCKNGAIQVQLQCLNSPKYFHFILCSILKWMRGFIAAFLPSRIFLYDSPKTLIYIIIQGLLSILDQFNIINFIQSYCGIPTNLTAEDPFVEATTWRVRFSSKNGMSLVDIGKNGISDAT